MEDAQWLFLEHVHDFTLDSVHNLQSGTSKMLRNGFVGYVWSTLLYTKEGGSIGEGKVFMSFEGSRMEVCNALLS